MPQPPDEPLAAFADAPLLADALPPQVLLVG